MHEISTYLVLLPYTHFYDSILLTWPIWLIYVKLKTWSNHSVIQPVCSRPLEILKNKHIPLIMEIISSPMYCTRICTSCRFSSTIVQPCTYIYIDTCRPVFQLLITQRARYRHCEIVEQCATATMPSVAVVFLRIYSHRRTNH